MTYKYDGQTDPRIHIEACVQAWKHKNVDEKFHMFVHTLDIIPKNWYTETELPRGTESWSLLIEGFKLTFGFESEYPQIDDSLEVIKVKVFDDFPLPLFNHLDWAAQLENVVECYNLATDEEEDPHNVNIPKSEGSRDVQEPALALPEITEQIKVK